MKLARPISKQISKTLNITGRLKIQFLCRENEINLIALATLAMIGQKVHRIEFKRIDID